MYNLEEMKLGFKKAYFSLNNQDKKVLLSQLIKSEDKIVSEKQISAYLQENKIYKESVLSSILNWGESDIYSTFKAKRDKELNLITKDLNNENELDKLLVSLNENVFNHFYRSFS